MSNLVPELFEDGEYRVLDLDIAERLGFERSRDIRQLIDRNRDVHTLAPEKRRRGLH